MVWITVLLPLLGLQLNARLEPFHKAGQDWKETVTSAYMQRIDLSAHGFYFTPDITGGSGNRPFNYYSFGAAVSEVELDVLTGDFQARMGSQSVLWLECRVKPEWILDSSEISMNGSLVLKYMPW